MIFLDRTRVCGRFWTRSFSSRHLLPEDVVPAGVNLDGLVVVFWRAWERVGPEQEVVNRLNCRNNIDSDDL